MELVHTERGSEVNERWRDTNAKVVRNYVRAEFTHFWILLSLRLVVRWMDNFNCKIIS